MAVTKVSLEEYQEMKAQMQRHRAKTSARQAPAKAEAMVKKDHPKPQKHELTAQVRTHVDEFLASANKYFANERDIQVRLVHWLATRQDIDGKKFYDIVETEYGVPLSVLSNKIDDIEFPQRQGKSWTSPESFPWHNNLSIDIVVCKAGRWVAIELKYATRRIQADGYIFGEDVGMNGVLTNQATANLAMYAYWKDVRRLEAICHRFKNVDGGLAVMVSNNSDCWKTPNETSLYRDFSMHREPNEEHFVGGKVLRWKFGTSDTVTEGHPPFLLKGRYPCSWDDTGIFARTQSGLPFKYMITNISKL